MNFTNSLRVSYIIFQQYPFPSLSPPRSASLFSFYSISCPHFKKILVPFQQYLQSQLCGHPGEHIRSRGATPLQKAHSYPQYCQLPMAPQLGVGLHSHLPFSKFSAEILSESNVHRFCACCHNHCEFIRANFLLCLEKTVSLWSSPSSGPYRLSLSLSAMVIEPWEDDCVIQMPHVGVSKLSHSFSAP